MEGECSKLATARYRKGWPQEQVAEAVGVTRSTLSQWERGVQVPQEFYVHRLCDFYQRKCAKSSPLYTTCSLSSSGEDTSGGSSLSLGCRGRSTGYPRR